MTTAQSNALEVRLEDGRTVVAPLGDWLARSLGAVDHELRRLEASVDPEAVAIDLTRLGRIDTAGAFALGRVLNRCDAPDADALFLGEHAVARRLMALVRERAMPVPLRPAHGPGLYELFDRAGRGLESMKDDFVASLAFFGEMLAAAWRAILRPDRVRWAAVFHVMEQAGVNALPVIATLSFFIGAVVAYLGANQLAQFGASVFAIDLVGISVLREFGVVITAILLAGRSDSAFTAQIGAMRMQQEVDAMRTLGLDPFDVLVLPRVIACIVMAPILTFGAMMMGLLGGMIVLWSALDLTPGYFISRMQEAIPIQHFWVGISKAPVFALVIAIIGCRKGLDVGSDVESLGHNVTASVVQSIFAVIVIDAIFAMVYMELDI
jgi:phospholipid/cholesterol/gamma-HCH transport system permease protein